MSSKSGKLTSSIVHKSLVADIYHNVHIEYGYRQTQSFYDAFMTLFTFHNETMNIWSHLIGFVCVVIAGINMTWEATTDTAQSLTGSFAFHSYIICAALCLFFSTLYHWLGCISEECHNCLLRLDLSGIALLVAGSFLPAVYYGFYCVPEVQTGYLLLTAFILLAGMAAPWIEVRVFGHNLTPFIFAALVAMGLVPFSHWVLVTPSEYTKELVMGFILMFFWYFMGFSVYILRVPEAFFPKSFLATHLLPSHAIWHICVLNAVYVWYHFVLRYRGLLHDIGCSVYNNQA